MGQLMRGVTYKERGCLQREGNLQREGYLQREGSLTKRGVTYKERGYLQRDVLLTKGLSTDTGDFSVKQCDCNWPVLCTGISFASYTSFCLQFRLNLEVRM